MSALASKKQLNKNKHFSDARAEISKFFLYFWKIDATTISFSHFLTFKAAGSIDDIKFLTTSNDDVMKGIQAADGEIVLFKKFDEPRVDYSGEAIAAVSILSIVLMVVRAVLKQTSSRQNHTSYRKFDFNEFVQNSLCCNMGMVVFDLRGYGDCQRPKALSQRTSWQVQLIPQHRSAYQEMRSIITFSLHSALVSLILEPNCRD